MYNVQFANVIEWIQHIGEQLTTRTGIALGFFHIGDLEGTLRIRGEMCHVRRGDIIIDKGGQLISRAGCQLGQCKLKLLVSGMPLTSQVTGDDPLGAGNDSGRYWSSSN